MDLDTLTTANDELRAGYCIDVVMHFCEIWPNAKKSDIIARIWGGSASRDYYRWVNLKSAPSVADTVRAWLFRHGHDHFALLKARGLV